MKREELRFRWLHASCYELQLPDGRVITVDPYVLPIGYEGFTIDSYTKPDYVLITHTHFDHVTDVEELLAKNVEARLYVGPLGAYALADRFDIHFGQICVMDQDDEIVHNGLKLNTFRGKHSRFIKRSKESTSWLATAGAEEHGLTDYRKLNLVGSVEYTDFLITTPDNFRIFLCGGDMEHSRTYEVAEKFSPDLVIRQASNFHSPEEYAGILARYHAQYALPHHQEFAERRLGMPIEEYTARTQAELKRLGSVTTFLNPEQFKWYSLTTGIDACE